MDKLNSKIKGDITEISCMLEFIKRGYNVSIPYGESAKYDFIVEINNKFYRFQSKTSRLNKNGSIHFSKRMIRKNNKECHTEFYTKNDIDYFCTYYNSECYIVDINIGSKNDFKLRIKEAKNNQTEKINFAENFTIDKFLEMLP